MILYAITGVFLGISTGMDLQRREVSLWICGAFGAAALMAQILWQGISWLSFFGGIGIGLFMLAAAYVTRQAIGYGDGIVVGVCGMYLGFGQTFRLLLTALLLAAFFGIGFILFHKIHKKQPIPFVPFLLGAYLAGCIMRGLEL